MNNYRVKGILFILLLTIPVQLFPWQLPTAQDCAVGSLCAFLGASALGVFQYGRARYTQQVEKEEKARAAAIAVEKLLEFKKEYFQYIQECEVNQPDMLVKATLENRIMYRHTGKTRFGFFEENRELSDRLSEIDKLKPFLPPEYKNEVDEVEKALKWGRQTLLRLFRPQIEAELQLYEEDIHVKKLREADIKKKAAELEMHDSGKQLIKNGNIVVAHLVEEVKNLREERNAEHITYAQFCAEMTKKLKALEDTFATKREIDELKRELAETKKQLAPSGNIQKKLDEIIKKETVLDARVGYLYEQAAAQQNYESSAPSAADLR